LGQLTVGTREIPALGIDPVVGNVAPTIDAGRLPIVANEIALGARTMRLVHAHLDDEIQASIDGRSVRLRVVGVAVIPAFGTAAFTEAGLGTGAIGRAALFPQPKSQSDGQYNYLLVRFGASGATKQQIDMLRTLVANVGCTDSSCVLTDLKPNEIDGFQRARSVPLVAGFVLPLLLFATLTHALLSTMRRRRGDLAVLRALGFTRRQLKSTLRWQTFMLTAAALVIGIPAGLVANRIVWGAFTHRFGIAPGTVVPTAVLGLGAAAVLVLGFALATGAGSGLQRFARGRPYVG
jgi:hypothetical protein